MFRHIDILFRYRYNVRSLGGKLDDINELQRDCSIDVFCMVETWHDSESVCSEISCNVKLNVYLAMEIPDHVSFVSGQNSDEIVRSCELS